MDTQNYTRSTGVELFLFRDPVDLYENSPELFFSEAVTYVSFLLGFTHAYKQGPEALLFVFITLLAASFVDPFCLISEQIRNYYHSHASILAIDRHVAPWQFPFFADLAYVGGAAVWALKLENMFAEACLVAFVSGWTFYQFDLVACRFLLYQWHTGDPLYTARTQCVPLASSMWVMTYAFTGSLLARYCGSVVRKNKLVQQNFQSFSTSWWAFVFIFTLIFLPLHILPISIFYFPTFIIGYGEYEAVWGFGLLCLFVGLFLSKGLTTRRDEVGDTLKSSSSSSNVFAILQSMVWFFGTGAIVYYLDPVRVISTNVHEPYGGNNEKLCQEKETYLFGMGVRNRYLCKANYWWTIVKDPKTGSIAKPKDEYYTIQGIPMDEPFRLHFFSCMVFGLMLHVILFYLASKNNKTTGSVARVTRSSTKAKEN